MAQLHDDPGRANGSAGVMAASNQRAAGAQGLWNLKPQTPCLGAAQAGAWSASALSSMLQSSCSGAGVAQILQLGRLLVLTCRQVLFFACSRGRDLGRVAS